MKTFFVGMHHPHSAHLVETAFISVNALERRKGPFKAPRGGWVMDSGAFTKVNKHGGYPEPVSSYAFQIIKWERMVPRLQAAVAQDYMCEPFVLAKTGLTVVEHQRLTVERYDELVAGLQLFGGQTYIMPVLQGYAPEEYVAHLSAYGSRLAPGAWVGVGSVCKRQGSPAAIKAVLRAIKAARPDLRLHGFGVKLTALRDPEVRELLETADSMAWSFSARKQGRDANDPREAQDFYARVAQLAA